MSSHTPRSAPKFLKLTAVPVILLGIAITLFGVIAVMIQTMGVVIFPIGFALIIAGVKTWRNGSTRFATITAFTFAVFFGLIFAAIADDGLDSIGWTIAVLVVALGFLAWGVMLLRARKSSRLALTAGDNIQQPASANVKKPSLKKIIGMGAVVAIAAASVFVFISDDEGEGVAERNETASVLEVDGSLSANEKFLQGKSYLDKNSREYNFTFGVDYFKSSCEDNHAEACFELTQQGSSYASADIEDTMRLYQKSCSGGFAKACQNLARVLDLYDDKEEEAIPYYEMACDGDIAEACKRLGNIFKYSDDQAPKSKAYHAKACSLDSELC